MLKLKNGRVVRDVAIKMHKDGFWDYRLKEKPARCPSEDGEATNFYCLAIAQWPHLEPLMFHVPNERKATVQAQMRLNQQGVKKGVSDYIILTPSNGHPYAVIELKRQDWSKSSLSKEQRDFLSAAMQQGAFAAVAYGWEAAIHAVNDYLDKL